MTATYAIWGLCGLYLIALIGDEVAARAAIAKTKGEQQ